MSSQKETPPLGTAGLGNSISCGGKLNTPKSPAVQAATIDLRRDFIAECLRIASIKAAHGADNVWLQDDLNAERDIDLAIKYLREAARSFRTLEQLIAGGEP